MTHCREEVYLVTIIQCSWMNLNSTDLDKGKGGKIVAHGSGGRQKRWCRWRGGDHHLHHHHHQHGGLGLKGGHVKGKWCQKNTIQNTHKCPVQTGCVGWVRVWALARSSGPTPTTWFSLPPKYSTTTHLSPAFSPSYLD